MNREEAVVRERIRFTLCLYPRLSMSMLQTGLGPHTKPSMWRPILTAMIEAGEVIHSESNLITPLGQFRTYRTLELHPTMVMSLEELGRMYQDASNSHDQVQSLVDLARPDEGIEGVMGDTSHNVEAANEPAASAPVDHSSVPSDPMPDLGINEARRVASVPASMADGAFELSDRKVVRLNPIPDMFTANN